MAKEVIVTSATRGIKPGRSGFQVVMRTRGMRDDLTSAIERLSEYRHIHAQGSGRNPILYAHKVLTTSEGIYSVLIQTVDAGNDFSSRSNKLSHCVALDKTEVAARIKSTPAGDVVGDVCGIVVNDVLGYVGGDVRGHVEGNVLGNIGDVRGNIEGCVEGHVGGVVGQRNNKEDGK